MLWLLIFVLAISLYDLRMRRIPNWYSLPLLIAGFIAHFPGTPALWFATPSDQHGEVPWMGSRFETIRCNQGTSFLCHK